MHRPMPPLVLGHRQHAEVDAEYVHDLGFVIGEPQPILCRFLAKPLWPQVEKQSSQVDGGVDVILDMVGRDYLQRNLDLLNLDGRLVIIALMSGAMAEVNLATLMRRRLTMTGSTLRARTLEQKTAVVDAARERVWPLFETGRLHPVIHQRLPLAQAAEAHRLMEASTHIGKLLLVTRASE